MIQFTLYSRIYCHLCDEMLQALLALRAIAPFDVTVVDVDEDAALLTRYDELVPVLVGHRDGATALQLCHYHLDVEKTRTFLTGQDVRPDRVHADHQDFSDY